MTRTRAYARLPLAALVGLALVAASCGGDGSGPGLISLTGNIRDASTYTALAQAKVCLYENDADCAVTDADGVYRMQVPARSELVFEVTKDGYWKYLTSFTTPSRAFIFPTAFFMYRVTEVEAGAASLGESIDDQKGHLWVMVSDTADGNGASGLAGAEPGLDAGAGGLLFFVAPDLSLDTARTSTSSAGALGYLNVAPGEWTVTVTHPEHPCKPDYAFPGGAAGSFRVTVTAGYTSYLAVYCEG